MAFASPATYDQAITIFSPDGRIFQVEYAIETVKQGSTVLGIACPEGVVLAAEERPVSKLQDTEFLRKIFQLDAHLGVAVAGLSSDARILIDYARVQSQSNRLTYDEPIDVEALAKKVGDVMQQYTQNAGVRPFGVSIILGGIDKSGARIFQIDPSGSCWAYKAASIGAGSDTVRQILEEKYVDDMRLDKAIQLAAQCISKAAEEGKAGAPKIKIAIIPVSTQKFQLLTDAEIEKYLAKPVK